MKNQKYIGCGYCDNLIGHPDQVELLHLGFPRCTVLIPKSFDYQYSTFEKFYEGLCEVNWFDPNDKGTPEEQEEVLRLLWNFLIEQKEEEERRYLESGGYEDDDF